jgi:hypothetical protein
MRVRVGWLLGFVLIAWVSACGYRFQGATAPDGATIEVPVFENRTVETGIETIVTERILAQMRAAPGWRVAPPGEGRYVLKGIVTKFVAEPHLVSTQRLAVENRATMSLDVRLQERATKKDLWHENNLRTFADYPIGDGVLLNERSKLNAVARIAEELAHRIRVRVQDTW